MQERTLVCANLYRDSVALMRMAADLEAAEGVARVTAVMATPANRAMLVEAGIAADAPDAGPNDLLIVVEGADEGAVAAAIEDARARLSAAPSRAAGPIGANERARPRSLAEAFERSPTANLALISCPGDYAAAEAMKALRLGLDVMMFSDNVGLADEAALKREAGARGLMVMGPDCGTAILGGIPLGFANAVRRGPVGIVAASGTGLQQVACLLDRAGVGVSHAFGTGGRDLSADVGGITTLAALEALAGDRRTESIVVVSKPPDTEPAKRVIEACAGSGKPCVICFIGAGPPDDVPPGIVFATTLEDAANIAAGGPARPAEAFGRLVPGRRIVGLYSGGTFCHEARAIAAAVPGGAQCLDARDLGDDAHTRGRPHPMIDVTRRCALISETAADPAVAVIVLDVVLGTGVHADPAGALAPAITDATRASPGLRFVAFVCGTEADPQRLSAQEARLAGPGLTLVASNAAAVRAAFAHLTEDR